MGEEKREELMESLFGAGVGSESDGDGGQAYSDEGEGEVEGEGEAESGGEREESEGEREGSEDDEAEQERTTTSRRSSEDVRGAGQEQEEASAASGPEQDTRAHDEQEEEEEAAQSEEQQKIRDTLGESDEDEQEEVDGPRASKRGSPEADASDMEGSDHQRPTLSHDADEEQYYSDAEIKKPKQRGEPLLLEIPLFPPPAQAHNMNFVRASNIMDIDTKPFDPRTYVETVVTDATGRRLRLEDNVVRWRSVKSRDGSRSFESNARFVKWSDGTTQLLIGNEVLDLSVQDDVSHLFVRHQGLLQSQGKIGRRMKFMPSSLNSNSHRLLSALVDSRHKKGFKVKNVITNVDPEKDKEQKEKAAEQRIKSREDLQKKQEKSMRKFAPTREREAAHLSPRYLESLDEEDDEEYDDGKYQEQLEAESRAERRITHAKRQPQSRRPPTRTRRDMMEEDSSEESDHRGGRASASARAVSSDDEGEGDAGEEASQDEDETNNRKRKNREKEEEQSPPRKQVAQRRKLMVSSSDEE